MRTSRRDRSWRQLTAGLIFGMCLSATAMAADIAPMPTKAIISTAPVLNPWTFNVTPYAWVPLLNGSTTVKGRTTDIDVATVTLRKSCDIQKFRKISWH
jgi:hypothetical protein